MTLTGWRIVQQKFARNAFTGEGARLYGGRWNSPGVRMVYLSANPGLATLEVVVHVESHVRLLDRYQLIPVEFDARLVEEWDVKALPKNWRVYPAPKSLQQIGDLWVSEGRSAVFKVPSAVVPMDLNYLLNPLHQDFATIRIGKPQAFRFDRRLSGKR